MVYNTVQMHTALKIARHAYAGRTDRRGKLLFLNACEAAETCPSEYDAILCLLRQTLSATDLTLEGMQQTDLDLSILADLKATRPAPSLAAQESLTA